MGARFAAGAALAVVVAVCGCSATTPSTKPSATLSGPTSAVTQGGRAALAFSGPPEVAYVDRHVLRFPGGRVVHLSRGWSVSGIVRAGGGFLVSDDRFFEGTVGMHRLDSSGRVMDSWASTGPPVRSFDGRVAWVSTVVPEAGQTGPTLLHLGDQTLSLPLARAPRGLTWGADGLHFVQWGRGEPTYVWDGVGRAHRAPMPLGTISPDGQHEVAPQGRRGYQIRDRAGTVIGTLDEPGLFRTQVSGLVWEDDAHLLGTLTRRGRQALVRIGLDGTMTRATPWRRPTLAGYALLA